MPELAEHAVDLDTPVEHSPLERDITHDGTTVRVFIYRGAGDPGWLLEVQDELGGSTVWDDPFASDHEALAEALRAVAEDGIDSFARASRDRASLRALWKLVEARPAIATLRHMLDEADDMMSFHQACGVFAAVATCPELLPPSAWLGMLKQDHVFADREEVQRFTNGVMELYSEVLRSVSEVDAHCCPAPDDALAVQAFCAGYVKVVLRDATWSEDAGSAPHFLPLCVLAGAVPREKMSELDPVFAEDPDRWMRQAREDLHETVISLYAYWEGGRKAFAKRMQERAVMVRREGPKVGRNEPCPCGSGKKSKKCCAH